MVISTTTTERPWSSWCGPCGAGLLELVPRRRRPPELKIKQLSRRRTRSAVLERADTASFARGSPSPSRLRIIQSSSIEERYIIGKELLGECCRCGGVRVITEKASKQRRVLKSLALSSEDDQQWEELLNEVEVYLQLDHPNICRLLEVYADEGSCHMVMELCTGRELFDRLGDRGRYSERDAAVAVAQMLDALRYMHNHSVCHRDLKLENWMYADASETARLKLIDFGFSSVFTPDTPMTVILGTIFYIAPEVFGGSYDFKCDVWSTGVISFVLLTGRMPFGSTDDSMEVVEEQITRGAMPDIDDASWREVSLGAKDFVMQLLTRDPALRPTAREAAAHSWLAQHEKGQHGAAVEISVQVLESMRSFASMNILKRAACGLIAFSMNVEETDYLEAQFKTLDADGNGTITLQELVDALKEHLSVGDEEASELFRRLDLTGDKEIKYSEFLAAANQRRFLAQESVIQQAFQRFDVDGTGCISVENLREVLGDEYHGTRVEDIIAQVDIKGNGVIEYEEFVRALMDLGCGGQGVRAGDSELVKKISRAFEFTSVGAAPVVRQLRRGHSRRLAPGTGAPGNESFGLDEEAETNEVQLGRNNSDLVFSADAPNTGMRRTSVDSSPDVLAEDRQISPCSEKAWYRTLSF